MIAASSAVYLINDILSIVMRTDVTDQTEPTHRSRPGIVRAAGLAAFCWRPHPWRRPPSSGARGWTCWVLSPAVARVTRPCGPEASTGARPWPATAGFVLRAVAGGIAVGIPTSAWFLTVVHRNVCRLRQALPRQTWCRKGVSGTRSGLKSLGRLLAVQSGGLRRHRWWSSTPSGAAELGSGGLCHVWARLSVIPSSCSCSGTPETSTPAAPEIPGTWSGEIACFKYLPGVWALCSFCRRTRLGSL